MLQDAVYMSTGTLLIVTTTAMLGTWKARIPATRRDWLGEMHVRICNTTRTTHSPDPSNSIIRQSVEDEALDIFRTIKNNSIMFMDRFCKDGTHRIHLASSGKQYRRWPRVDDPPGGRPMLQHARSNKQYLNSDELRPNWAGYQVRWQVWQWSRA
jgi:hypothetical protein